MWHAWEGGEMCTAFWCESPKEKGHLKDQGVDGRMGSKWTVGRLVGRDVEWIHLAQDRDRWWAVVNMVMNPQVLVPWSLLYVFCCSLCSKLAISNCALEWLQIMVLSHHRGSKHNSVMIMRMFK
jgi:hypothetical protein